MNVEALKLAAMEIVRTILEDEEWDDAAGQLFLMLARKAADATETEFDDKAVEYLARKLGITD